MTFQAAFGAVLLVGLPVLLLALGVLAHAYYIARPRSLQRTNQMLEELVAESLDQLIAEIRATAPAPERNAQPRLAQPVEARMDPRLEPRLEPRLAPASGPHGFSAMAPTTAHAFSAMSAAPMAAASGAPSLRHAVGQLLSEGLSDRTIARRLGVGIEEVRAARMSSTYRSAA